MEKISEILEMMNDSKMNNNEVKNMKEMNNDEMLMKNETENVMKIYAHDANDESLTHEFHMSGDDDLDIIIAVDNDGNVVYTDVDVSMCMGVCMDAINVEMEG